MKSDMPEDEFNYAMERSIAPEEVFAQPARTPEGRPAMLVVVSGQQSCGNPAHCDIDHTLPIKIPFRMDVSATALLLSSIIDAAKQQGSWPAIQACMDQYEAADR